MHYTRKEFNPNAPGLSSLQWDSAELFQIGVQNQMSYDDAFTIEEVVTYVVFNNLRHVIYLLID